MFRTIAGVEVELRIVGDMQTSRTVQILSIDSKLVEPRSPWFWPTLTGTT